MAWLKRFRLPIMFGVLATVLTIWLIFFTNEGFTGTLLPELIGFALEGLVFVGLFTVYQRNKEQKQIDKMRATAYRTLYIPLYKYADVLFSMHKATATEARKCKKVSISSFLTGLDVQSMGHVGMQRNAPVSPTLSPSVPWCEYVRATTETVVQSIEKALDRYGWNLSAEDVELLESVASNPVAHTMGSICEILRGRSTIPTEAAHFQWQTMFMTQSEGPQFSRFQEWVNLLTQLSDKIDASHKEVKEEFYLNWQTNVAPKLGQELPILKEQVAQ